MGGGSSKSKKKAVQPEAPKQPPPRIAAPQNPPSPSPSPPPLPHIASRQPSVHTRASVKRNSSNLENGSERRTPLRKSSNKTPDDLVLPPIANGYYKSPSRVSRRSSSGARVLPIQQSQISLKSLARESTKQSFRQHSPSIHHQSGRCSKCPHCRRLEAVSDVKFSPQPEWFTKDPGSGQFCINMDHYDVEAVKDQIIGKNHRLLGSYDYEPYLVIEQIEGAYDPAKENYYKQPFIAKTDPTLETLHTPFPEYNYLERHEHRLNKPYSVPLFE